MKKLFLGLFISFLLASCGPATGIEEGLTDPILTWDAVTTDCIGNPMSGITYNVYAIQGSGPIPTTPTSYTSPCGIVNLADIPPLNSVPITTNMYTAFVSDGVWTFAVEAVSSTGNRSGLSDQVTVTVVGRPSVVINLNALKVTIGGEDIIIKINKGED